ncbi:MULTISPECIES: hypothetical protein [unclassified Clostridioides]|uniref:hypothetical protein n=1 Tax=unclassified Clostridioides TaxID=2635829 RepID=UPI0024DFEFAF
MSAIIVAIILMLLGISIFIYFMPVSIMLLALLVLLYFIGEKQKFMGILSCIFLIFTIYLWSVWDDIISYTEEKLVIRKEQRMQEEETKKEEWQRANEEDDARRKKEKEEKYGIEISAEDLENKLEPLIPQEYRGANYKLEVYSIRDMYTTFNISVQNEIFKDEKECKKFIRKIATELKDYEIFEPSFAFYSDKTDDLCHYISFYNEFRDIQTGKESVFNLEID